MGRFVLLVVALFVLIWLVRGALSGRRAQRSDTESATSPELVRCFHCGVHVPRGEAIRGERGDFCSEDHRRLGPRGE